MLKITYSKIYLKVERMEMQQYCIYRRVLPESMKMETMNKTSPRDQAITRET